LSGDQTGKGGRYEKNCVILKWNPGISSYSTVNFLSDIIEGNNISDWSVHEYGRVRAGDTFFMLKVGTGSCGIVAAGEIISDPAAGGDWSGRGREVYYSDYRCEIMVNPATLPIIESDTLENHIPCFDWRSGHSGTVLDDESAEVLDRLYCKYLHSNAALFDDRMKLIARRGLCNDQLYIDDELFNRIKGE